MTALPRIALVHGPTPIVKRRGLDEMLGIDLWIKRDDATSGAEAGNKVRKLEFLLGDAIEQRRTIVAVSRASGLVLDPVYSGKAMYGLEAAIARGELRRGARVLFLHTGGLPGLLAQGDTFGEELA